jgi:hypothetical protein
MDPKIIAAAVAKIRATAKTKINDLAQGHDRQQKILDHVEEIERDLEAAASAPTNGTAATYAKTPSKPSSAALLAEYRRLSGEARQVFFNEHQDALWSASVAERNAKSR